MAYVIPSIFTAVDKVTSVTRGIGNSIHELANRASVNSVRAERSLRKIGGAADGVFNKIVNLRSALAVGFVVGGAAKLFNITAEVSAFGDELSTTAARLGMTTQAYQELGYAAKLQNIENETLTKSFEKLNKNLGDLHSNQGTLVSKLKDTNPVLLKQLKHAKDSEQAFNLISAAILKLPNQMQRASLAQAAFGKAGQEMLNLIQAGPDAINKMREEARKLGFVLSDEAVAAAQQFDDAHDRMSFTLQGLKNTIGAGLMPVIQQYMEKGSQWVMNNRELIQSKVAEWVNKFKNGIVFLVEHMDKIILGVKLFVGSLILLKAISIGTTAAIYGIRTAVFLYNVILGISTALQQKSAFYVMGNTVAYYAYRGAVMAVQAATYLWTGAQWLLNAAFIASPIGWIVLGIAALVAIVVIIAKKTTGWGETWDSVMKWMGAVWDVFSNNLKLQWLVLKSAFMFMVEGIVLAWKWGQNLIGNISDEQYAKDKARIAEEQRMRVNAIKETTAALIDAGKRATDLPDWKVKWAASDSPEAPAGDAPVKPLNPKAQMQTMVSNYNLNTKGQNSKTEIIIRDQTGKAEVGKNPNNIPITIKPSIGIF